MKSFIVVSGEGLGLSNTTYRILRKERFNTSRLIGHANIQAAVNIANGNLIIRSSIVAVEEQSGPLHFYWTYNSSALKNKWQFNWNKKLFYDEQKDLFIFTESDGHLTTYRKDPNRSNQYFAQQVGEGNIFIRLDEKNNRFRRYNPLTHVTEYYDLQGKLIQYQDLSGHDMNFVYDNQNRLSQMICSSKNIYQFNYFEDGITLLCIENGMTTQLRNYVFDNQGNLSKEVFPKTQYTVQYLCTTSNLLEEIKQTDGSLFTAIYSHQKISQIKIGEDDLNRIDYQNNYVILSDVYSNKTEFFLDSNQMISQVNFPIGYRGVDKTSLVQTRKYQINNGLLTQLTQEDNSCINYQYDPVYYLIISEKGPENQYCEWFYLKGGDCPLLISQADYLDNKTILVTRSVYEPIDDNDHYFLRFSISPLGSVEESRPDQFYQIASKRKYISTFFDLTNYSDPSVVPAMFVMENWVNNRLSDISLTTYERNLRGQVIWENSFSLVDSNGKGIKSDQTTEINKQWDMFGNCLKEVVKKNPENKAKTEKVFDDLNRCLKEINALNYTWQWDYKDSQQSIELTLPNQRKETTIYDSALNLKNKIQVVQLKMEKQERETQYRNDLNGLALVIIPPSTKLPEEALRREHQFFDRQYRKGFSITPLGIVTEIRYNDAMRYQMTIQYATQIDIKKLYLKWPPTKNDLPENQFLFKQLQPSANDRVSLVCFTPKGKIKYQVDAKRALTEYVYDNLDRRIFEIAYKDFLTDQEWNALLNGQSLTRKPNSQWDRISQIDYDHNNNVEFIRDPAGFCTQYFYDAAKRKIRMIREENGATTYHYYDKIGNEIGVVDPSRYLTLKTYDASRRLIKSYTYAKKLDLAEYKHNQLLVPPKISTQDKWVQYEWDLLDRKIFIKYSNGKQEVFSFDEMNNLTQHQVYDFNALSKMHLNSSYSEKEQKDQSSLTLNKN